LPRRVKPRRYESPIRAESAERTRQNILDAARELFGDHGYAAMTMHPSARENRRADNMKKLAGDPIRTGEVRAGLTTDRITDTLWVWSTRDYAAWLADSWCRLLL
jgi:hypothetical protein